VTPTLAPLTLAAVLTARRATPGVLAAAAGLGGGYGSGTRKAAVVDAELDAAGPTGL
jgi:hypothetical protein